jgi:DNA-directed RNA polymerase I, II, and III subunit RPABC1
MLSQRGYKVLKQDAESIIAEKTSSDQIVVFFNQPSKLDKERVIEYINLMSDLAIYHSIIVFKNIVTPVAKKVIEELPSKLESINFFIELFDEKNLRFNITKHRLVPKHEALSKAESLAFIEKFGVKIPVLLRLDPVARFYNFQRGEIIKITRSDKFISFRIVH